jgi:G3E family GTPase
MDYDRLLSHAGTGTRSSAHHRQAPAHDHFHTLTYLCTVPLVRERFEHFIRSLPSTIWRAKGFVRFTDSEEQWIFQYVVGDFAMEWIDLLPEPPEHVVFIGKGFDREAVREALIACAAAL